MRRVLAFIWTPLLIVGGFSTTERKWDFLLPSATIQELMDLDANSTVDPMAVDRRVDAILRSLPQSTLDQMDLPPFYDSLPFGERWQIKAILFDRRLSYEQKHRQIIGVVERLPAETRRRMEAESDERRSRYFEGFATLQYRVTFNFRLSELRQTLSPVDGSQLQNLLADAHRSVESKTAEIESLMATQPTEVLDRLFFSGVPIVDAEIRERFRRLFIDRGYWGGGAAAIPRIPVSPNPWRSNCGPFCGEKPPMSSVGSHPDAEAKPQTHQIVIKLQPVPGRAIAESSPRALQPRPPTPFVFPQIPKSAAKSEDSAKAVEPPCSFAPEPKPAEPKPSANSPTLESKNPQKSNGFAFGRKPEPQESSKSSETPPKPAESAIPNESVPNRPPAPFYAISHPSEAASQQPKASLPPNSQQVHSEAAQSNAAAPKSPANPKISHKAAEEPTGSPRPLKNWVDVAEMPSIIPHPFAEPKIPAIPSNPVEKSTTMGKPAAEINPIDGSASNPRAPLFPSAQMNPIDGSLSAAASPPPNPSLKPKPVAKSFWDERKQPKVFAPTTKWRPAPNRWAAMGEGSAQPLKNPWAAAAVAYNRKDSPPKPTEAQNSNDGGSRREQKPNPGSASSQKPWTSLGNGFAGVERKPEAVGEPKSQPNVNTNSQGDQKPTGSPQSPVSSNGTPKSTDKSSQTAPVPENFWKTLGNTNSNPHAAVVSNSNTQNPTGIPPIPQNPSGSPQIHSNPWKSLGNGFAADRKPDPAIPARSAAWTHTDEQSFLRKWYEKFGVRLRDHPEEPSNGASIQSGLQQPPIPKSTQIDAKSKPQKIPNPTETPKSAPNPPAILLNPKKSEKFPKPIVGISPSAVEFPPLPGASTSAPPASARPWPAFDSVSIRQSASAAHLNSGSEPKPSEAKSAQNPKTNGHQPTNSAQSPLPQNDQIGNSAVNSQNSQPIAHQPANSPQNPHIGNSSPNNQNPQPSAHQPANPLSHDSQPVPSSPTSEHDRVERHGVRRNGVGDQPPASTPQPGDAQKQRPEIKIPTVVAEEKQLFGVGKSLIAQKPKEMIVTAAISVAEPKPKQLNGEFESPRDSGAPALPKDSPIPENSKTEKLQKTENSKSEDKSKPEEENQKEESEEEEKNPIGATPLNDSTDQRNSEAKPVEPIASNQTCHRVNAWRLELEFCPPFWLPTASFR